MENHTSDEKGSSELYLWMKKLSLSSDQDQPHDTTLSDPAKAARGSGHKRDQSSYLEDEVSAAADDIGGRPGSIYKTHRFHFKKARRCGHKYEPFMFMSLPREIRNIIYEKTLTRPDGRFFIGTEHSTTLCRSRAVLGNKLSPFTRLSDDRNYTGIAVFSMFGPPKKPTAAVSTRNLSILRTSKAIHAEAGTILYGQKLIFTDLLALQSFLSGLKQSQIRLLRHVAIGEDDFERYGYQRAFMPGVFALLAGADNLETLRVPGIDKMRAAAFNCRDGLHHTDHTTTVERWDAVVARNLAAEVYCRLFTYLREAVAIRGIDEVMEVLDVFEKVFRDGPDCFRIPFRPRQVVGVEWTEDRKVAMKKAMGEEIERLLEADNN